MGCFSAVRLYTCWAPWTNLSPCFDTKLVLYWLSRVVVGDGKCECVFSPPKLHKKQNIIIFLKLSWMMNFIPLIPQQQSFLYNCFYYVEHLQDKLVIVIAAINIRSLTSHRKLSYTFYLWLETPSINMLLLKYGHINDMIFFKKKTTTKLWFICTLA